MNTRTETLVAPRASAPAALKAKRTLWLLAGAAAVGIANLYYAQPLAAMMAKSLAVTERELGFALMLSQLGYALGMLLLVPLGDGRERRSLMVMTAGAATVALLATASAPTFATLAVTSFVLGFTSSLPQMVIPYACAVVPPQERGKAIGTVMAGLLSGVLLSRTVSGTLASVVGWRMTFVWAAVLMASLTSVLRFALPRQSPAEPLAWGRILASLAGLLRTEPLLRRHAVVGAMGFAAFSAFWSTLSFHLATMGHGSRTAGLFGAIGLVGVTVAPVVGRLSGRVPPRAINAIGLGCVVVGFALFQVSARFDVAAALVVLALGVVLLDAGVQGSHIANQTIIFGLKPELRNRLNAVYMVSFFGGGALGTSVATTAWAHGGWSAVCLAGIGLTAIGFLPLLRPAAKTASV